MSTRNACTTTTTTTTTESDYIEWGDARQKAHPNQLVDQERELEAQRGGGRLAIMLYMAGWTTKRLAREFSSFLFLGKKKILLLGLRHTEARRRERKCLSESEWEREVESVRLEKALVVEPSQWAYHRSTAAAFEGRESVRKRYREWVSERERKTNHVPVEGAPNKKLDWERGRKKTEKVASKR